MHLHVSMPEQAAGQLARRCVRPAGVGIYSENCKLKKLFCETNALNVGSNCHRTLQKAGFKYVKTYMTVPGAIQFPPAGDAAGSNAGVNRDAASRENALDQTQLRELGAQRFRQRSSCRVLSNHARRIVGIEIAPALEPR